MKISIVVPCYNEGKIIFDTYRDIKREIEKLTSDYEIIFANDGSIDKTKSILDEIAKKDKKVKVLSWSDNRGVGYAYRNLYEESSGEVVIEMDADLSTKPAVISRLIDEIGSADVVIASKYAGIRGEIPLSRRIPSRLFYLLSKCLLRVNVKDIGSGFVAFRKEVLDSIDLSSDGFDIYIEVIARISKEDFRIIEIPVEYIHRSEGSKLNILKHVPSILIRVFSLWLK